MRMVYCIMVLASAAMSVFPEQVKPPAHKENTGINSVSLHPFSLVSGVVGLNYERLLFNQHGVVVEGFINTFGQAKTYTAFLNYRYHFKPKMDSWFVGAYVKRKRESRTQTMKQSDSDVIDTTSSYTYLFHVGLNGGKKWVLPMGLTFSARLGYGFGVTEQSMTTTADENDEQGRRGMGGGSKDLQKVLSGIDSELSIGWSF